jgi:hypothetical protein
MQMHLNHFVLILITFALLASCSTLEKASVHGLTSGYYTLKKEDKNPRQVYLDVTEEKIDAYPVDNGKTDKQPVLTVPLIYTDTFSTEKIILKKEGLDVDITSILLKYRPAVAGLPAQLNTDLNVAIYAGWRHDRYTLKSKTDPLGRHHKKISSLGYDIGFFAGPGTTSISPTTTLNRREEEYSGMIFQTGIAGFIESNMASFGIAVGYDHLLNTDRKIWIYRNKPWVGFIVGIALN